MAQSCPLPFASKSITEHLLRGALGLAGILFALKLASAQPIVSVALIVGSLVALRGCPMCWIAGFFGTLQQRIFRRNV